MAGPIAAAAAPAMPAPSAQDPPLPPLREDLRIQRAGPSYDGSPAWVLFDPVANRHFRLSFEMFQILSLWDRAKTLGGLRRAIEQRFERTAPEDELEHALRVLEHGQLLSAPIVGGWRALHAKSLQHRPGLFKSAIHNYLYFRIPLVRPERHLKAALPFVSVFFTRSFVAFTGVMALVAIYLAARQWEVFTHTFSSFLSLEGLAFYVTAIMVVKSLHELGHAFSAVRAGCRVPTMGLAFLVLAPMLYTDVTDAWRLRRRSSRLLIDCAGILVELGIAVYALLLWSFLPAGPLQSLAFSLCTVSLFLSLMLNLSPLMRFDGYYILSDLWGIENLQMRAFAMLRWRIRETLFGLGAAPPEHFGRLTRNLLLVYAVCAVIYRLVLYLGIALLVYHFFIKIVGIGLFIIEIVVFILRPVILEIAEWRKMRAEILSRPRTWLSLSVAVGLVVLCFLPLSTRVHAPAILEPAALARVFPAVPGQVESVSVAPGQSVRAGDVLARLRSPDIDYQLRKQTLELAKIEAQLAMVGADAEAKSGRLVLETNAQSTRTAIDGLHRREQQLVVRAPIDGRIAEASREVHPGRWLSLADQIAVIEQPGASELRGYVHEQDLFRLAEGGKGVFVPEDLTQPSVPVEIESISGPGADLIDIPYLTSTHGGKVDVYTGAKGEERPAGAYFGLRARADGTAALPGILRGSLVLDGRPESLALRAWRQILKVGLYEAGF
jgi:putative peptide zinc metalloprotease protein